MLDFYLLNDYDSELSKLISWRRFGDYLFVLNMKSFLSQLIALSFCFLEGWHTIGFEIFIERCVALR